MNPEVLLRNEAGRRILDRVEELARHSDSTAHYTRTFLTPAHRKAAAQIAAWMGEAGLEVRTDAIGNVIGRYEGASPAAATLLIGSHFDSVRNGGKYDGVLGILVPVACVAQLKRGDERLPFAIEVVAFSDEEGARFQTSFLSSRALIGRFDRAVLSRRDAEGVAMSEALRAAGLDPAAIESAKVDPRTLAGYLELHIEQGPVLLGKGAPLGVVTTIAGGSRNAVKVTGERGHAGTVPMPMRHDALAAAAEMVLAVEKRCASGGTLVGTVGILKVREGTGNVIAGEVEFTCDIRAGDDATRHAAESDVFWSFQEIARRRGVKLERARHHEVQAVPCSAEFQAKIAASIARAGFKPVSLASGAGHDAMILAQVTEVGMLFVRCGAGGVSHSPEETVTEDDAGLAAEVLLDFLRHFAG